MKRTRKRGILTVEAAIILPLFILVLFFILSLLQVFYYHLVMQQALNNAGRTLAQYGYVADNLLDLDKLSKTEGAEELSVQINAVMESGSALVQSLEGGINLGSIGGIITKGKEFGGTLKSMTEKLEDKDSIINYLVVSAVNAADNRLIDFMVGEYLKEMEADTGNILNLDYAMYIENGSKDILLVARYDFKLPFPFFTLDILHFEQAVRVHPWTGSGKGAWK